MNSSEVHLIRYFDRLDVAVGAPQYRLAEQAHESILDRTRRLPWLFVAIFYVPLALMVLLSLVTGSADRYIDFRTIKLDSFTLSNYATVSSGMFTKWVVNTLLYAGVIGFGSTFLAIAGAYALLKMKKRLRTISLGILLVSLAIPTSVIIIPLFLEVHYLGLTGLPAVLIKGLVTPWGIIIAHQFLRGLPDGYFESAVIDGANNIQIIWHIIIPLSKPLFALVALTGAMTSTVDYLWQSVNLISPKLQTVLVAFTNTIWNSMFALSAGGNRLNIQMAMGVLMFLPTVLIFLLGRKYLLEYTLEGGVKE